MLNLRERLENQLTQALITGFEQLGGDPLDVIDAAKWHDNAREWIDQESTKIAVAGGAGAVLPGLNGLTLAAGMTYLLHKMANIGWGVGYHEGAYVLESSVSSDLTNILTVWVNDNDPGSELERRAISMDAVLHVLTPEGSAGLEAALGRDDLDETTRHTLRALQRVRDSYAHTPRVTAQVRKRVGPPAADEALAFAQTLSAAQDWRSDDTGSILRETVRRRISTVLAREVVTRLLAEVPLRLLAGFVPVAGMLLNAWYNAQVIRAVAGAAVVYYRSALTVDELVALAQTDALRSDD